MGLAMVKGIVESWGGKISVVKARHIGINAFAYKPFTKADFAKTVKEVLRAANS